VSRVKKRSGNRLHTAIGGVLKACLRMGFFIGLFRTFSNHAYWNLAGDFQHDGRADTAIVSSDDGDLPFKIHNFLPD
jgi:hypothetical protein